MHEGEEFPGFARHSTRHPRQAHGNTKGPVAMRRALVAEDRGFELVRAREHLGTPGRM